MSARTVYHHIANNKSKVRKKKQGRATLFHAEDFAAICNLELQWMQTPANEKQESISESQDASLQQKLQGLQKEYQIKEQQADNLQKVNSNLTNQLNRYAELLSEEKSEKKELLQKYDTLQTTYQQKIERFSRKYYLLLWLFLALLVFLIYQYAGNFREAVGL